MKPVVEEVFLQNNTVLFEESKLAEIHSNLILEVFNSPLLIKITHLCSYQIHYLKNQHPKRHLLL